MGKEQIPYFIQIFFVLPTVTPPPLPHPGYTPFPVLVGSPSPPLGGDGFLETRPCVVDGTAVVRRTGFHRLSHTGTRLTFSSHLD